MAIYCLVYCTIISTIVVNVPHPVFNNRAVQMKVTDTDPVLLRLIELLG